MSNYFKQAELSLAAYSNLNPDMPLNDYLIALGNNGEGLSPFQANIFANTYRIITQHTDATGLSATIFANDATGETFLAIRGTEITDPGDLFAGLSLITFGTTVLQPQYASLKTQVQAWLNDGTLPQTFSVTGHSLGGFLATGLVDDPAFANNITHAYLYNAPGMGGIVGSFADTLLGFMGLSSTGDSTRISNIEAATGAKPIAGLGFDVAPLIDIIIEDQTQISGSPPSKNHSQQVLTDTLAIYQIYAQAAPNLTQSQLNTLIDAFGTTEENTSNSKTLETALDALRFIASGPTTSKTEIGNRDELYKNLNNDDFKAKLTEWANTTQFTLLADKSAGKILDLAKDAGAQGLAVRYALVAGNPFALTSADYSSFNTGDALERFDPTAGTGKITDDYLNARIQFLERAFWFNTQDQNPYNPSAKTDIHDTKIHIYLRENIYFEDAAAGYKIQQGGLFANTPRYYFGDDKANNPSGSASKDYLFGGAGGDSLTGGESDDYLEGGTGNDTYTINTGDGIDTIWDADGQGVIRFGTVEVKGKNGVDDKDWVKLGNS